MWVAVGLAVGLPFVLYLEYLMTDRLARGWLRDQSALTGELLREKISEPADDIVESSRHDGRGGRWQPARLNLETGTALVWVEDGGRRVTLPLETLLKQLREVPLSHRGYVFLLDSHGTMIASLDSERAVTVPLAGTPAERVIARDKIGSGLIALEDPVYQDSADMVLLKLPRLSLSVGMVYPDREVTDQLAPLVANLLVEAAVLLTLAWLFSYLLARRLTAPLEQLAVAVARIVKGEQVAILPSNVREISALASAFTRMRLELASYLEQLERTTAESARVGRELELARAIQGNSDIRRDLQGWQVEGRSEAAREVGGDFFEVFDLADGRTALLLGDVSGKGIPAALYTLLGRAGLKFALSQGASPAETLTQANQLLIVDNPDSVFTTALVAIVDPSRGELSWARAGHPTPLTPKGHLEGPNGPPLGLLEGAIYREVVTPLGSGPYLLYTDGFSEAEDEKGHFLTVEPLRQALERGDDLWSLLQAHRGQAEPSDDATAVLLKPL